MKILHLSIALLLIAGGTIPLFEARLRCPKVDIPNGISRIRRRIITYRCLRGYTLLGEPYAACHRGKWDPDPPVCIKSGCNSITLKNGHVRVSKGFALLEFSCLPGYSLVGPSFIYCNGRRWNAMQPYCKAADISCDFEREMTCSWSVDTHDDDDFMWHIQQHEPLSRILGTGPKNDHTFLSKDSGHYLMIETNDYAAYGAGTEVLPARIHSPKFPLPSNSNSCFIFWYHMFGATVGMLNIFLNNKLAFQEKGNHGDRWIKGVVPLPQNETDLQIMIEGTHGGGHTGDIALDDFSIGNDTDCLYSKVTSCKGRCNKNDAETATCLCNPECYVDSSCCEDYTDFCEITTTTFENSDVYEENFSENSTTENMNTFQTDFTSSEIVYSSQTPCFDEDASQTSLIENITKSSGFSSPMVSETEELVTSTEFPRGNSLFSFDTERTTSTATTEEIKKLFIGTKESIPPITQRAQEDISTPSSTKKIMIGNTISSTFITFTETPTSPFAFYKPNASTTQTRFISDSRMSTDVVRSAMLTTAIATMPIKPDNKLSSVLPTQDKTSTKHIASTFYSPSSINKISLSTKYGTVIENITDDISQLKTTPHYTSVTKKVVKPKTINRQVIKTLKPSTKTTKQNPVSTKHNFQTTSKAQFNSKPAMNTTQLKINTKKFKLKQTTFKMLTRPISTKHDMFITIRASTAKLRSFSSQPTTSSTTYKATTKKKSTTPANFETSTKAELKTNNPKNEDMTPLIQDKDIMLSNNHTDSSPARKSHPLISAKEKYQLSSDKIIDTNETLKNIIIPGICIVFLVAGAILVAFFLNRRRGLRFVNDSEGDVLYASSEEMLDLHLARPSEI